MKYSIIIPVHNEISYLSPLLKNLKSFANDHEIIIVDDGSNDGSEDILLKCPSKYTENNIKL